MSGGDEGTPSIPTGTQIGRYVVLHMLGAGGMGVVLAAYDPQLDRKVAIKLLRPRGELGRARSQLQREAQALAKLDHPNVVSVHDVGVHEEQLYLAMDFVAGQTLERWLQAAPRSWQAIRDVFVEAGRGLAAAHAAGLVHRDFKPDNVMIDEGASRRVRVMDFGLARTESGKATLSQDDELGAGEPERALGHLTVTGAVMGTPAYMPLEQFDAGEVDARSDQFAFCVALYEALYGERPFAAHDLPELLAALVDERIREAPSGSRVPAWLRRAIVRGLASEPERRWPSMHALLAALLDDPAPRRHRWLALAVSSSLLAGLIGALVLEREAPEDPCRGAAAKLAGVWDEKRRLELELALAATKVSYAADTWQRVAGHLDAYASAWVAGHTSACVATQAGEQSAELLDLRMACLEDRRTQLAALVDELAHADAAMVQRAAKAAFDLPTLDHCADAEALLAEVPPPEDPAVRAAVERLDERLAVARAKHVTGRFEEGETIVVEVLHEAEGLAYEPLLVRAWLLQGLLETALGRFDDAAATFERTLESALALRMTDEAADAATQLAFVVGDRQGNLERGRAWARLAGALSRASSSDVVGAAYENSVGVLAMNEGMYDEARTHHERALALRSAALGPEHPLVATSHGNLGNVAAARGDFDEARRTMSAALDIQVRTQGPEHPDVGSTINNLGTVAAMRGDLDEARRRFEEALAIWERSLGPEHPDVAYSLGNLGALAKDQGRYDDARAYLERSLAIWQRNVGGEHEIVANALDNLGSVELRQGRFAAARDTFERALDLRERIQAADHPQIGYSLTGLGRAWLGLGEPTHALPLLERALVLRTRSERPAYERGETRFALAKALLTQAPARIDAATRARALELARLARADYGDLGETEQGADIDAWLAVHGN